MRNFAILGVLVFIGFSYVSNAKAAGNEQDTVSMRSAFGYMATQCSEESWRSFVGAFSKRLPASIHLELPAQIADGKFRFAKSGIELSFKSNATEVSYRGSVNVVKDACSIARIFLKPASREARSNWILPSAQAEELVKELKNEDALYVGALSAAIFTGIYAGSMLAVPTWGASAVMGIGLSSYAASSETSSADVRRDFLFVLNNRFDLKCDSSGVSFQTGNMKILVSRDNRTISLLQMNGQLIYRNDLRHAVETSPTTAAAIRKARSLASDCKNSSDSAQIIAQVGETGQKAEQRLSVVFSGEIRGNGTGSKSVP